MTTKIPANLLEATLDLSSHTLTLPPTGSRAEDGGLEPWNRTRFQVANGKRTAMAWDRLRWRRVA